MGALTFAAAWLSGIGAGIPQQLLSMWTQQGELDQREYNAGRVIGILERWLMYSVIVTSQNYNVIAIIIAAKGIARFRELDRREFAEYVLIGTLASTLLTIVVGEAVIRLIE